MPYQSRRHDYGWSRGTIALLLLLAAVVGAGFWFGPLRPLPGELHLLVLGADGEFADSVRPRMAPADPFAAGAGAVARAPLILGVQNAGARVVRPGALRISVPGRFRLTGRDGEPFAVRASPGSALVQYSFELPYPDVRPGRGPVRLPGVDTLWLEPMLHEFDCGLLADSVPEFVPAPQYSAEVLANVRLYYSFETGSPGVRHSGLLNVALEPALLQREAAPMPARGGVSIHPDGAPRPDLGPLRQVGTRTAQCGDPEVPVELHTTVWEGAAGALLYEIRVGSAPRKLIYDLNSDGHVDLEVWDADGSRVFAARREARYAVPSLIRPLPQRTVHFAVVEPPDSAWLVRFHSTRDGPFRFAATAADGLPATPGDAVPAAPASRAVEAVRRLAAEPVDTAWLDRFHDSDAGPFRFAATPPTPVAGAEPTAPPAAPATPAAPAPAAPPAAPVPAEPTPAEPTPAETPPAETPPTETPPAETPPAETPRAPRPPPRLLGEPVPWPPTDTLRLRA